MNPSTCIDSPESPQEQASGDTNGEIISTDFAEDRERSTHARSDADRGNVALLSATAQRAVELRERGMPLLAFSLCPTCDEPTLRLVFDRCTACIVARRTHRTTRCYAQWSIVVEHRLHGELLRRTTLAGFEVPAQEPKHHA